MGDESLYIGVINSSGTTLNSDALPTAVPQLSVFSENPRINFFGENGGISARFGGNIFTVTPVPEPGEWGAMAAGLLGVFALVRRRLVRAR